MSGYLNKATLIGNLGNDPEVRTMQNGGRVVTLSVATSESWKDQNGDRQERTEWHRVVIFNDGLGKVAEQFLVKGAKVYIEGHLRTRKWQDQSGADRYSTEIVLNPYNGVITFLDSRKKSDEGAYAGPGSEQADEPAPAAPKGRAKAAKRQPAMAGGGLGGGDLDDNIPFAACWQ